MPSLHGALKHLEVYRREIAIPKYFASLMLSLWPPPREPGSEGSLKALFSHSEKSPRVMRFKAAHW